MSIVIAPQSTILMSVLACRDVASCSCVNTGQKLCGLTLTYIRKSPLSHSIA